MKALVIAILLCGGCGPWLYAASTPPPGAIGTLDTDDETAEISEGTALAFRCEDAGPCQHATATSDDPDIADVLPANLARLDPAVFSGMAAPATFVIVGKAPGHTRIRVRSSDGGVDLSVHVIPADPADSEER